MPKRPGQLLTFFVSNNNGLFRLKVFVLDRLDLVQESSGVLHPRRYSFGNVVVGWLEDHRYIAKWVREDCGPQYHLLGSFWMLYDVYDYFVTPTGWGIYKHNTKIIFNAIYSLVKPLGIKLYNFLTLYRFLWLFYHHGIVAFCY